MLNLAVGFVLKSARQKKCGRNQGKTKEAKRKGNGKETKKFLGSHMTFNLMTIYCGMK